MGTCSRCDGDGKIECSHCKGSGYEPDDNTDMSISGWVEATVDAVDDVVSGPEECSECNGKGEIDCPDCNGTGEE